MKSCKKCGSTERYKNKRCAPCTRAANQRWKKNNPEKHIESSRRWDQANPQACRDRAKNYAQRNRKKIAIYTREWRKKNADKHCSYEHKRRAAKGNGGGYTAQQWHELCQMFGHVCLRCGRTDELLTVDHITPLSRGGANAIANIQPLCGSCNSIKGVSSKDYRIDWMSS